MKKLKRYQYERYAVLCKLTYPKSFDHVALGFAKDGHVAVRNYNDQVIARILWRHDKKEVVVVFRGSQSVGDWLNNLCCFPKRIKSSEHSYYVHFGYHHQLHKKGKKSHERSQQKPSVFSQIEQALLPLLATGKRISFTGHSSGGAMAVLVADMLERSHKGAVKRVVTFGQPAAGFHSFKKHYLLQRRTYRVCCDLDIITFLPPLPGMFFHVGRSLWLHNERIYENIRPTVRLYKTLLSWLISPISYHYMHKYIRNKDFFDEH